MSPVAKKPEAGKTDSKLGWLRKGTEPTTKNTTKDDAEGRKCPVTKTYSCPTDIEQTKECTEC